MFKLNTLSNTVQLKHLQSLINKINFLIPQSLRQPNFLIVLEFLELLISLYAILFHLFCLHPHIINFPFMFFCCLVHSPNFVDLVVSVILDHSAVVVDFLLSLFQGD